MREGRWEGRGRDGAGNGVGGRSCWRRCGAAPGWPASTSAGTGSTAARLAADPDRLSLHRVDITDPAAVAALPGEVIARHGSVDGLIHLAAIIQPFLKADLDDATSSGS